MIFMTCNMNLNHPCHRQQQDQLSQKTKLFTCVNCNIVHSLHTENTKHQNDSTSVTVIY